MIIYMQFKLSLEPKPLLLKLYMALCSICARKESKFAKDFVRFQVAKRTHRENDRLNCFGRLPDRLHFDLMWSAT